MTRTLEGRKMEWTARAFFAAITSITALLILLPVPAVAAEGSWIQTGGSARTPSTPDVVNWNGGEYRVVRGEDDAIWWSYNNGPWRPVLDYGRTSVAPIVLAAFDTVMVVHTGLDGQVYYSVLQNLHTSEWTSWTRIPGNANTVNMPAAAYSSARQEVLFQVTDASSQSPSFTTMRLRDGAYHFPTEWSHPSAGGIQSLAGAALSMKPKASKGNYVKSVYLSSTCSTSQRIQLAEVDTDNLGATTYREVPGGGLCDLTPSIGNAGPSGRDVTNTSDPNFALQNQFTIAVTSPNDHEVWLNRSTDGGSGWSGWRHANDGNSPTTASPSVNSFNSSMRVDITWDGNSSNRFPHHSIVEKQL
ncbi:hypothetical protein [Amycolatopsis sp. KNN50.9b]|uniref:hypothetical protein n=1 Tax=Amycolatopsis sp. KNN50.9b TaxID=2018303 RepID=UPI001178CCD3|nr:hypothetical protein [Amycolatopsis sp. KNN50.9b]